MIIWSRWGILAVLFFPIGLGIGFGLIRPLLGSGHDPAADALAVGIGLLLSSAIMWVVVRLTVGKVIDKPKPVWVQRELAQPFVDERGQEQRFQWVQPIDPATGAPAVRRPRSTLFFIPMQIWPFIFAAIALIALVSGTIGLLDSVPGTP